MKKWYTLLASIALAVSMILSAGCSGVNGTGLGAGETPVSIAASPVRFAEVDGVMLGYREFGAGEPLLLIQGFGGGMDSWNEIFLGILASRYHVYIYDPREVGHSGANNATPTIPQYAADAAGLMKVLGFDSMNVYGVSMGSSVAQQLVIDKPERVRKLVLSSSSYSIRIPECADLLAELESTAVDPAAKDELRRMAQANLAWNGSADGLAGIDKEVMLIVGTDDTVTPDSVSEQMAAQINGSWLVRFDGVPHGGEAHAPVEYGRAVVTFLDLDESPAVVQ